MGWLEITAIAQFNTMCTSRIWVIMNKGGDRMHDCHGCTARELLLQLLLLLLLPSLQSQVEERPQQAQDSSLNQVITQKVAQRSRWLQCRLSERVNALLAFFTHWYTIKTHNTFSVITYYAGRNLLFRKHIVPYLLLRLMLEAVYSEQLITVEWTSFKSLKTTFFPSRNSFYINHAAAM